MFLIFVFDECFRFLIFVFDEFKSKTDPAIGFIFAKHKTVVHIHWATVVLPNKVQSYICSHGVVTAVIESISRKSTATRNHKFWH